MTRLIDADKFGVISLQGKSEDFIEGVKFILEKIDEAPTVEWPHGEWIRTGRTNVYGGFEIECSHCHTKIMVSPSRWEIGEKFCDVCGAEMRKSGEAE